MALTQAEKLERMQAGRVASREKKEAAKARKQVNLQAAREVRRPISNEVRRGIERANRVAKRFAVINNKRLSKVTWGTHIYHKVKDLKKLHGTRFARLHRGKGL